MSQKHCLIKLPYLNLHALTSGKSARESVGDTWTWIIIDSDCKLIASHMVGGRDSEYVIDFMNDRRDRLANPVQLTTDGNKAYPDAAEGAFGGNVDYAHMITMRGDANGSRGPEGKYSPAECTDLKTCTVESHLDEALTSTSYVERQNLTMWMHTRLSNSIQQQG